MRGTPVSGVRVLALGLSLGAVGLWVNPAQADSLYNNLSNAPASNLGTFPIGGTGPEGDSFSTGGSAFLLTDVLLKLQGVQDSARFNVSLFSDNNTTCAPGPSCSGGPLTALYTIATVSDNSASLANYDFSLAVAQTLAANTRYWIIASSTNGSGTLWSYTSDLSGAGVAGEFNTDAFGLIPNSNSDPGCFLKSGANQCTPFQMEVVGTPVPEPGSLVLLSMGLAGLVGVIRRK